MRVFITGGTGLIGRTLANMLGNDGHEVLVLTRDPARAARGAGIPAPGVRLHQWDARSGDGWAGLIESDSAVINLAGENPARLRTAGQRRAFVQSRLDTAAAVWDAIARAPAKPRAWLQASAVGYYGERGDAVVTEADGPGRGFLAETCARWEAAAAPPTGESDGIRRVVLRIGIVLSPTGGALPKLVRASRWSVSRFGSGRQWVPWVHEGDAAAAIRFLLLTEGAAGPFNVVAPGPVPNAGLFAALAGLEGRRTFLPVPRLTVRVALGGAAEAVLDSQRVMPQRLLDAGFGFQFSDVRPAVADLLSDR